jgi:hypothetical protein
MSGNEENPVIFSLQQLAARTTFSKIAIARPSSPTPSTEPQPETPLAKVKREIAETIQKQKILQEVKCDAEERLRHLEIELHALHNRLRELA